MKVLEKPTVRFSQQAFQQMNALTDACPIEISAMGVLASRTQRKEWGIDEEFYVLGFHVPDQECSGASTVMETDSLSELTLALRDQGVASEQICVWWHSHVNMGVGHSGTDEKQIEDFHFDKVCISIITNKKRDINVRVDIFSPFRFTFEGCSYSIDTVSILDDDWAQKMVDDHVSKPAPRFLNVGKTPQLGRGYHTGRDWYSNPMYHGIYPGAKEDEEDVEKEKAVITCSENINIDPAPDEESETNVVVQYHDEGDWEDLNLPMELDVLEDCYRENIITLQELLDYHAKWYANELNVQELQDALKLLYHEAGKVAEAELDIETVAQNQELVEEEINELWADHLGQERFLG